MDAVGPRRVAYLGLGSNIGERRAHLKAAVAALSAHGVTVVASSSVYETEPVGLITDQPEFLNACLKVATSLDPEELLDVCKEVERESGRDGSGPRHGPRVIDVDLLLLGEGHTPLSASRCPTPRSRPAGSCSCRCSSSTPSWRCPAESGSPAR